MPDNVPLNKLKVEYRHPSQLSKAPFEPQRRLMQDKDFWMTVDSIRQIGICSPLQITPENRTIDGHRRRAAAIYLHMPEVPVIVNPYGLQLAFAGMNNAQKRLDGRQYLEAYALGLDLAHVREAEAKKIEWLLSAIGNDGIVRLADHGASPEIASAAKRLAAYLGWTEPKDLEAIIWWFVECDMQRPTIDALKADPPTPARVFVDAIRRRRKLTQQWVVAADDDSDNDD